MFSLVNNIKYIQTLITSEYHDVYEKFYQSFFYVLKGILFQFHYHFREN